MNKGSLRETLDKKENIDCVFLRLSDPTVAEVLARAGIKMFVLDCEHYCFSEESMLSIIRACNQCGAECLIRVKGVDSSKIGRLLDAGACGVLLADTESAEEVRECVNAVKYPPLGKRGVSTDSRNNWYGYKTADLSVYPVQENENTVIGVIIETEGAINTLDDILSIPELDFASVGTMDLSYALGVPGQTKSQTVVETKQQIYKKILEHGKAALDKCGSKEDRELLQKKGISCFYIASDIELFKKGLRSVDFSEKKQL